MDFDALVALPLRESFYLLKALDAQAAAVAFWQPLTAALARQMAHAAAADGPVAWPEPLLAALRLGRQVSPTSSGAVLGLLSSVLADASARLAAAAAAATSSPDDPAYCSLADADIRRAEVSRTDDAPPGPLASGPGALFFWQMVANAVSGQEAPGVQLGDMLVAHASAGDCNWLADLIASSSDEVFSVVAYVVHTCAEKSGTFLGACSAAPAGREILGALLTRAALAWANDDEDGPEMAVYLVEKVLARPPVMEQLLFGCPGADDAGAFWPADTRPARERSKALAALLAFVRIVRLLTRIDEEGATPGSGPLAASPVPGQLLAAVYSSTVHRYFLGPAWPAPVEMGRVPAGVPDYLDASAKCHISNLTTEMLSLALTGLSESEELVSALSLVRYLAELLSFIASAEFDDHQAVCFDSPSAREDVFLPALPAEAIAETHLRKALVDSSAHTYSLYLLFCLHSLIPLQRHADDASAMDTDTGSNTAGAGAVGALKVLLVRVLANLAAPAQSQASEAQRQAASIVSGTNAVPDYASGVAGFVQRAVGAFPRGIPTLLELCQSDVANPYIREWALLAVRFITLGSMANQQQIMELEAQADRSATGIGPEDGDVTLGPQVNISDPGVADALERAGMRVRIDPATGRLKIHRP
ncbi:hypothetical protein H696_00545 [Fonticula alba]|uniref:Ataxin-10 domain-containing protein n=1 Tax=Fonticula alba TaxID=691883 RepID=A0A058ZGE7_FONAL|nr:hypothetical protein H696_00545 [Fonticula alba]KCV72993.1 hypothetical protein H696_00545 [Fonticula alba]|eukprot:XP_009492694.1 hypothetical protein H696_00545 [Fonticula alba]